MEFAPIVTPEQRAQMLALLEEGFPQADVDWPAAFQAPPGRSGHGLLLIADGEAQGGLLFFEKIQTIRGRQRRVVNFSSWYMRPAYRFFAIRVMQRATADPDAVYMICTPTAAVQTICRRTGFRYISHGSIASLPLINGVFSREAIAIEPHSTAKSPIPEHDQWMADHSDERHIRVEGRVGGGALSLLWLRGLKLRGFSAARLLFASDYAALRSTLPALHWHMLSRYGIAGLYLPRVGLLQSLRSVRKPHSGPSVLVKGDIDPEDVNLLYSEFLYLRPRH
jgi:hypothetical protein